MKSVEIDSAARLLSFIVHLKSTLKNRLLSQNNERIGSFELSKTFERIAEYSGHDDYVELFKRFLALSKRVRDDLERLQLFRESVRERARAKLDIIEMVFSPSNFTQRTSEVFDHHFSSVNLEVLEDLSDRFQSSDFKENSLNTLNESFDDISDLASFCENSGKLGTQVSKIIQLHLEHLKSIIDHYDNFGETDFWDHYAILFSTFMQLHDVVVDEENNEEFTDKMKKTLNRLVFGSSLIANAITIGVVAVPLLT